MGLDEIRIRILVDNKGAAGLVGEHGFAAWIEVSGHTILFDTGQGQALVPNAAVMGSDLSRTDTLILSHGHYDHSGALSQVLPIAPTARVYCNPGCFLPRYSIRAGEAPRNISMAVVDKKAISTLPSERIHWAIAARKLFPSVGITGPIPRVHPLEDPGGPFFLDPEGMLPDPIEDDLAIWIETSRGLLIITGCCHSGLINTVTHIRAISGVERVHGIVGGLHLANACKERLDATCSALRQWHPDFIMPCHCTGDGAVAALRDQLGSTVTPGHAGLELHRAL